MGYRVLFFCFLLVYIVLIVARSVINSAELPTREWKFDPTRDGLQGWNINTGKWEIYNNSILGESEISKSIAYREEVYVDLELESTIRLISGRAGIVFNFQNILNYYEVALENQEIFFIVRMTDKSRYISSAKISKAKEYTIRIIQKETNIKVSLNGKLIFNVEDATFSSGGFGLAVQHGKAYFSNISARGTAPLKLKNARLEIAVDERTGSIKSLVGSLDSNSVQFCDATALSQNNQWGWGTILLDYGKGLITSNDMERRIYVENNEVITEYINTDIKIEIKRKPKDEFLDETYVLTTTKDLTIDTLGVVFRPTITMHVGEQLSYFFVDNTPTVYHWFTGKNLAYLLITHNNGRPPHLAIVLVDGEMNGYSPLYNLGIRHIPLASSPVLFVTGYGIDKRESEYYQPRLQIGPDKPISFSLRYLLFNDWQDMEDKLIDVCNQPVFHYPRYVPVGKTISIEAKMPPGISLESAEIEGINLPILKMKESRYIIKLLVQKSGLQKVKFRFSNKKETYIFFEGMCNMRDLIEKRAEFILKYQFNANPQSPEFNGIFPVDLLTKESLADPNVGNCQQAGTGEITASSLMIIYKNLINPNKEEIENMEIYANRWLRGRCQDENYACYLNPLNKAIGGDGMGFRIWNANWIATIYYYLSLFDDKYLGLQSRDTYLLWAYNTLKWFFSNRPTYISPEPHMIRKIINELYNRGYKKEAKDLEEAMEPTIESILSQAQDLSQKGKEWTMDANAFIPMATFLFLEGYDREAMTFLEPNITDLGYSYDPRIQSAFRIWDDSASGYYYKLIPYPTMPHFWTSIVGYSLLLAYERYHKEEFLESAYNSIMSLYESYNYEYPFNLWGKMKLGEAHAAFLPGLGVNTQERACSDQDGSFSTYLETFGTKCYITKTGKTINCDREDNKITSWAAYPREYILENIGYRISTTSISTVINSIELKDDSVLIEIENLRKDTVETELRTSSIDGKLMKTNSVRLKSLEKQLLNIKM